MGVGRGKGTTQHRSGRSAESHRLARRSDHGVHQELCAPLLALLPPAAAGGGAPPRTCLVPGAGLCRLAWEISRAGWEVRSITRAARAMRKDDAAWRTRIASLASFCLFCFVFCVDATYFHATTHNATTTADVYESTLAPHFHATTVPSIMKRKQRPRYTSPPSVHA
jgi:hypothetical protein